MCTFQRDAALRRILGALDQQRYGDFEIVVVDNAPEQPGTSGIVERFGRAKYVPEPKRGTHYARNAGIRRTRGEIVALIDDDRIPHPRWAQGLLPAGTDAAGVVRRDHRPDGLPAASAAREAPSPSGSGKKLCA